MSPHEYWYTQRPDGYVRYWYQVDSFTAIARITLSGRPHLQAAHWKISSVVPVNCPSTRGSNHEFQFRHELSYGRAANDAWTAAGSTSVWLRLSLNGRGSHVDAWSIDLHAFPEGSDDQLPTGANVK